MEQSEDTKQEKPKVFQTFDEVVEEVKQKKFNYLWRPQHLEDLPEGPRCCASKGVPFSEGADLMMKEFDIILDQDNCTECGICWVYCPLGVVYENKDGSFGIDSEYCRACGVCVVECPTDCIKLIKIER